MAEASVELGQLFTLLILSVALGMDAFSLGIGVGMRGILLRDMIKVSAVIALFHIIMPLMGMFMGHYVSILLGDIAVFVGGGLLILLGSHMVYSSLKGESALSFDHRSIWGLLLFALSVSVDSMSVGVSLGLFSSDVIVTVLLFGTIGGLMSILGLMVGRRMGSWIGEYGEALGGLILFLFGIKFLI